MIYNRIELEMNTKAYQQILGTCGSIEPDKITNIQDKNNGVKINFNDSLPENIVRFYANYTPYSKK